MSVATLNAEASNAARETAALREDASAAARRADEARRRFTALEKETAQLSSQADTLRATKAALHSELAGLRHELDAVRGRRASARDGGAWRGDVRQESRAAAAGVRVRVRGGEVRDFYGDEGELSYARQVRRREAMQQQSVGDDGGGGGGSSSVVYNSGRDKGEGRDRTAGAGGDRIGAEGRPAIRGHGSDAGGGGGGGGAGGGTGGNLVDLVAEFQGRLRRQVQAALAKGTDGTAGRAGLEHSAGASQREGHGAALAGQNEALFGSGRGGSRLDVLDELEKRMGSV